jgi:hypothetical protein
MTIRRIAVVGIALLVGATPGRANTRASAAPAGCVPACAGGFVCAPNDRCVSACNPPCSEEEQCRPDGSCAELVAPTTSRPPAAPYPVASAAMPTSVALPRTPASTPVFGASIGGAYVPPFSGPGSTWAGFLEVDLVKVVPRGDYRVGALFAYASTYYEESTHAALVSRATWNLGSVYAVGSGFGLGYGSFSARNGLNGDNGGSITMLGDLMPMLLRFGPNRNLELSLHGGLVYAFSFGGVNPFGGVTLGFVTR